MNFYEHRLGIITQCISGMIKNKKRKKVRNIFSAKLKKKKEKSAEEKRKRRKKRKKRNNNK